MESLQAWGFALRATTPQVASGYDPTGRSVVFYKIDRIHYFDIRYSLFDIRHSLFYSFFFNQTGRFTANGTYPQPVNQSTRQLLNKDGIIFFDPDRILSTIPCSQRVPMAESAGSSPWMTRM